MKNKNRILLYSILFTLVTLFVAGVIYQKYYYEKDKNTVVEEIPEIKEEFKSITYKELRSYNDSYLYLDSSTKEIIREDSNKTYFIGTYGKLYTTPIIDNSDNSDDKYEKNEVHRFDKYSVYATDDDYNNYYIINRTTNETTDIFSEIYPIYYDSADNDESRYFILINSNNDTNEYYIFDSNDESIIKFDDNIIDINPGDSGISHSVENLYSIKNALYLSVTNKDNKCGLIDYKTNYLIEPKYDELYIYNNSMMVAKLNGKFGIINSEDEILLNFQYDGIEIFDNYILVIKDKKIGVLSRNYEILVDYEIDYDNSSSFIYTLCCADSNSYYAYEDDNLILQTVSSNDVYFDENKNVSQDEFDKYVNYYVINKDGIIKKINGYSIDNSSKYIIIASIDSDNVNYTFYDYNYNKKSEFDIKIDHPELDYYVEAYNENRDYFSLSVYYPNNEEIEYKIIYVDALNNKQLSKFDTEYRYFDNGYGYRIDEEKKQIEIYKGDELLSTNSNIEDITYVGDYMFIIKDITNAYKIIKVTFNKES